MHVDVGKVFFEAANNVEDERVTSDDLTKMNKGIRHVLELAVVVRDGEVALDEVSKGSGKVKGTLLVVANELVSRASQTVQAVVWCAWTISLIAVEPHEDSAVHACLVWEGLVVIVEDTTLKSVLPTNEKHLMAPAGVVI